MKAKFYTLGSLFLAAVVAPAVIGVYGGEIAGLLRVDALLGLGVVATLVALIMLEYRPRGSRSMRAKTAQAAGCNLTASSQPGQVIPLRVRDERAAA